MDGIAIDTDLRERCIEAMARAFIDEAKKNPVDRSYGPVGTTSWVLGQSPEEIAGVVLDAALSVLADHAEEWHAAAWGFPALSGPIRYVEALKEDT